jgi:ssDNA thymidine ADP-ribosyltransferase, DarT
MPDLNKTGIYRMMHIENVPHVLQHGITHAASPNANAQFKSIGDKSLINSRSQHILPNGRTLGAYIPFYFGRRTPMLYVIQKGHNGVNATPPEHIVYCVSTVQKMIDHEVPFIFTDGHATSALTRYYEKDQVSELDEFVKRADVDAIFWKKEADADLKRRKEAEFLAASDIPPEAIRFWIVFNETAKDQLRQMGILDEMILVRPEDYF